MGNEQEEMEELLQAQKQASLCAERWSSGEENWNGQIGAFTGTQKKVYDFWKKGAGSQEAYKDVIRSCREKTRKVKAQLELNLAAVV